MNKYSSKAVKTAATVGMSLAMVLSNAAPVFATQTAGVCAEADKDSAECGRDLYVRIKDAMGESAFADIMMDGGTTITVDNNSTDDGSKDTTDQDIIRTIVTYNEALSEYRKATASSTEYTEIGKWLTAVEKINEMFNKFTTVATDAADLDTAIANLNGIVKTNAEAVTAGGDWADENGDLVEGELSAAKAALKDMNTFEDKYFNNMSEAMQSRFAEVKSSLEILLTGHMDTSDETIAKFVEAFDKVLQGDIDGKDIKLTQTEAKLTGYGSDALTLKAVNLSSKTALKQRINKIKDADDYDDVKDSDAVIALIDAYQELIDNLGDLSTILTSDAYKTYTKTKTDDADETVRSAIMKLAPTKYDAVANADKALEEVKKIAKELDSEQWTVLKDLKADVLDLAFDFATKKIGNYYSDKGAFVDGVTASQISTIKANVPGALLKVVDTETGEFGFDYLEAHMEKVEAALAAVTTDIAKITPANIKTTDKAALEAAEDAIYELYYNKGKYVNNLTDKELKTVRQADTKITNLREAFDNLGTTAVAGWYDMGNGNWGYNNEDGTPAAYKWVASGSDWYMIKDGKMLRNTWLATDGGRWYYLDNAGKMVSNQSVDGCWINSYGVYMSPSYNG